MWMHRERGDVHLNRQDVHGQTRISYTLEDRQEGLVPLPQLRKKGIVAVGDSTPRGIFLPSLRENGDVAFHNIPTFTHSDAHLPAFGGAWTRLRTL